MKLTPLAALAALVAVAGCAAPGNEENHWHMNSIAPRTSYHFLGYRADVDGAYLDRLCDDGCDFGVTLRRHFLNDDPEHPRMPQPVPTPYRPQPPSVEFKVGE